MPIRLRSWSLPGDNDADSPRSLSPCQHVTFFEAYPEIVDQDSFRQLIKKLSIYINEIIFLPVTFEQLRTTSAGAGLQSLVEHLSDTCRNPAIVNALLALRWHYATAHVDKSINDARANAAEIIAWRFLTHLNEQEVIDYCLYEIPNPEQHSDNAGSHDEENGRQTGDADENTALLAQAVAGVVSPAESVVTTTGTRKRYQLLRSISRLANLDDDDEDDKEEDPTKPFVMLNALEIAAIADAKRFLSQHVVQKIITDIWYGDIMFWDQLTVNAVKKPHVYNKATADPYSRLRVPRYLKIFEVCFFLAFLFLYYSVLVDRNPNKISAPEVGLYIWFAAFLYDELSEWADAGSIFYATDLWNLFDITMICIGFVFATMRIVGLSQHNQALIEQSFDILSLEALFMVPRLCSILSLSQYWGTLIPCLKEMGKDFMKFMVLVVVLYLGFLTTFALIGRENFTPQQMAMNLTKIFYGSSYVGFDIMKDIDPLLGPPLMFIFVTLSSILLMGSLTGMLSNSFSRVISHAREEYLYVYSVYVLEASTSNRLTHFYPPFNLLALIIFRPFRLLHPSANHKFRATRIVLLKATHFPIVGAIMLYELIRRQVLLEFAGLQGPPDPRRSHSSGSAPPLPRRKASQPRRRPVLAGSPQRRPAGQPKSSSVFEPLPLAQVASMRPWAVASATSLRSADAANDNDTDAPTDVEIKLTELSGKIDKLMDIIGTMQQEKEGRRQTESGD